MNELEVKTCTRILYGMRQRCSNPKQTSYPYYGGRGIKVCDEWLGRTGVKNFIAWAEANGYKLGLSIERINNDLNYCPSNCKWIEVWEQKRNRQCNVLNKEVIGKILYMKQEGYSVRDTATHLDIKLSAVRGLFLYTRRDVEVTPFEIGTVKKREHKKFSEEEVRHIRTSGLSNYKLADQYGVTHNTIQQIKKRLTYKNFI